MSTIQTGWCQDSILISKGDSILVLSHSLILQNTESIITEGKLINDYKLDAIAGIITLHESVDVENLFIVDYEYIVSPFKVCYGSAFELLPKLKMMGDSQQDRKSLRQPSRSIEKPLPLVTDGSIFRGISISSFEGMSMSGGLRMRLQGQLTDDLTVVGTLSDQNSPIQPEGNTQTLEEIDKVYLEIKHPSAKIVAGDIDMKLNRGQYIRVNRRLEGIAVDIHTTGSRAGGYLAGSNGKYHRMYFLGEEQNQGPYTLTSENGSRNIIVLAGSERVWIDGERMERGENNDYIIDYSSGVITFTTNQIINENSRIYVEYEYSDMVFPREIATVFADKSLFNGRLSFSLGWLREKDNTTSESIFGLSDEERDILKGAGDDENQARISTVSLDSSGCYRYEPNPNIPGDSILVYICQEERDSNEVYYSVTFHNVGSKGEYLRKVSSDGKIYFEYVAESLRDSHTDLYVPWKDITAPESHDLMTISTQLWFWDSTKISLELAGSQFDQNTISSQDDQNNLGSGSVLRFQHYQKLSDRIGALHINMINRRQEDRFVPLQRDRKVEFNREWNLTNQNSLVTSREENLTEITLVHTIGKQNSSISYGSFRDKFNSSTRWEGIAKWSLKWIPSLEINITDVATTSDLDGISEERNWIRHRVHTLLLPGKIQPYFKYDYEQRSKDYTFRETSGGVNIKGKNTQSTFGLTHRSDYDYSLDKDDWKEFSEGVVGEMNIRGRWTSGYRISLLFKQRFKSYSDKKDDINFTLARGTIGYSPRYGFFNAAFDFKIEQSLFEQKIAVYDSVADGLGNYRYDPDYQMFVSDPGGNFVRYFIPSGDRVPASHLMTGLRFSIDFRRKNYSLLKNILWKVNVNTDFNGSEIGYRYVIQPRLTMDDVQRSRVRFQQEINYLPRRSLRKWRITTLFHQNLYSPNSSETDLGRNGSIVLNVEEPLTKEVIFIGEGMVKKDEIQSTSPFRERNVEGWQLSTGVRWKPNMEIEIGGDLYSGIDSGTHLNSHFAVDLLGIGIQSVIFIQRKGRIHGSLDIFRVSRSGDLETTLPPEAARGMQIGNTIRGSVMGLLSFGKNLSANINISYTKNPLHLDPIIRLNGEVRANF